MVRIGFVTCVLLIALRLAIGWHVTYEGLNKYESTKRGKTDTNRPFSSQGYFAEAEGPLGPKIRDWLGDADHIAIAKLTLKPSNEDKPSTKMPEALEKEWNEYARQFEAFYKLSDDEKKAVETKLEKAKSDFVLWRTDSLPPPKDGDKKKDEERKPAITISAIGTTFIYRGDYPVERRFLIYDQVVKEIRQAYEVELPKMGRDVEKTRLRDLKNKAGEIRADLMKDVDSFTVKMRESLSKIVAGRLGGVDFGADDALIDDRVLAMVTPDNGTMPATLDKQWDDYLEFVRNKGQDKLKYDASRGGEMLADAKTRYVRFLLDRDQYTGEPLPEKVLEIRLKPYREAVANRNEAQKNYQTNPSLSSANLFIAASIEPIKYRQSFMDDIRRHTSILWQNLGGFASDKDINRRLDPDIYIDETITFDNNQGTIRPEKEKVRFLWHDWPTNNLEWMNWSTWPWGLLIAGLCILFGLFTRLACLGVAAFLLVEILSNTPFPWLPTSPKSEGSYAFVNKNTVEMLALLLLATLPTGRWLGLDALLSCIWPFRRRTKPTAA